MKDEKISLQKPIIISKTVYNQLIEEGRQHLPYEACGFICGCNHVVHSYFPLKSEIQSTNRFLVGKESIEKAVKSIQKRNEKILAIYHTHPTTSPIPSRIDLLHHPKEEKLDMVIISYKYEQPVLKWYKIMNQNYKECLYEIMID